MEQYARGNEEQAKVELERVGGKGQGVGVRGVELPVPEKLRELTEVIGEQPPSQMPTVEEIAQEVPALKDCFISYHPADYQWALWIVWQLEEAGYSVMLQPWNFEQGADFAVELDKATKVAQRIIVIYSRAYLNTLAAMPGWNSAFLQTPNLGVGLLLPIRVDDCDPDALLGPTD